jgi:hypothetical protein
MTGTEGERGTILLVLNLSAQMAVSDQRHDPATLFMKHRQKVPILVEAGRAPGPAWTNMEKRKRVTTTGRLRTPDRRARCGSLDQLRCKLWDTLPNFCKITSSRMCGRVVL